MFGDPNWKFGYPVGHPKPDIQMQTFLEICFYAFIFLVKKIITCWIYKNTGENTKRAETFVWRLLLIFKVVYWDHLTQLLPFARDFLAKGQRLVWGQVG